jgi:hypothetical protein
VIQQYMRKSFIGKRRAYWVVLDVAAAVNSLEYAFKKQHECLALNNVIELQMTLKELVKILV